MIKYVIVAVLVATGVAVGGVSSLGKDGCQIGGSGAFTTPDGSCTPGAWVERKDPCKHRARKRIDRSVILKAYGVDPEDWKGEIDHRIPHFLGGKDTLKNLWPEKGSIPNQKDKLEFYVFDRVCDRKDMSYATAVELFKGDWREAYKTYNLGTRKIKPVRRPVS